MLWFLLPFRAKNPPERFPWVTISLIVLNVLVYALTTRYFLVVTPEAVRSLAVTHDTLSPWRLVTAMFLHENPLHLLGNMLFLWIFGAPTEGRLGPLKFTALYFFAGLAGGLFSDYVQGLVSPDAPFLGASGAIMGLAGAYLYLFPASPIRLVWFFWALLCVRFGIAEWQARWVILYYLFFDVLNGLLYQGADGVAHFAHIGGAMLGFVFVLLLRVPRDDEDMSAARAVHADIRDFSLLTFPELEGLMQHPTEDPRLVLAYCSKAFFLSGGESRCVAALHHYGRLLMERAEPYPLCLVLLRLSPEGGRQIPTVFYLRLGSSLERLGAAEAALHTYRRLCELMPDAPDAEAAWHRAGRLLHLSMGDADHAAACYQEQLRRFPRGAMAPDAQMALERLRPRNYVTG